MLPVAPASVESASAYLSKSRTEKHRDTLFRVLFSWALFWVLFLTPIRIRSGSMSPGLETGDLVLAEGLSPWLQGVFRDQVYAARVRPGEIWIKRVVGLPGDYLALRTKTLFRNGSPVPEELASYQGLGFRDLSARRVPEGRVFLLGDNRNHSEDSRDFGPVPERKIQGRVFLRIWPPERFGWISR